MAILALPVAAHAGIGACGQTFGLLGFWGADGAQDWAAQGVVAVAKWHDPVDAVVPTLPGLTWPISPGSWTELPDLTARHAVFTGQSPNLPAAAWDGLIAIPADGGYTFHLIHRDGARLVGDGMEVAKTGPPFALVCGSRGNAMRNNRGSLDLRAGKHTFHLEGLHSVSQGSPQLFYEGPALPLTTVPEAAYTHPRQDCGQTVAQGARRPLCPFLKA